MDSLWIESPSSSSRVVTVYRFRDLHNILAREQSALFCLRQGNDVVRPIHTVTVNTGADISALLREHVKAKFVRQIVVLVDQDPAPLKAFLDALVKMDIPDTWSVHLVPTPLVLTLMQYSFMQRTFGTSPWKLPSMILPWLYLGNYESATSSFELLQSLNISYIVNASNFYHNAFERQGIKYLSVPVDDLDEEPIHSYFEEATEFLSEAKSAGKSALVHCAAGVSRSTTLVLSFLMATLSLSLSQACTLVRTSRPIVDPNSGFVKQLLEYYRKEPDSNDEETWPCMDDFVVHPFPLTEFGDGIHKVHSPSGLVFSSTQIVAAVTRQNKDIVWIDDL